MRIIRSQYLIYDIINMEKVKSIYEERYDK